MSGKSWGVSQSSLMASAFYLIFARRTLVLKLQLGNVLVPEAPLRFRCKMYFSDSKQR